MSRAEHGPTRFSERIKFSPHKADALFFSTSPSVVRNFSGQEPGSALMGYLPFAPMQTQESPIEFVTRTEYPMMDGNAVLSNTSPMSNWQKYELPYRLQVGRSLQRDMAEAYTGPKYQLNKIVFYYFLLLLLNLFQQSKFEYY